MAICGLSLAAWIRNDNLRSVSCCLDQEWPSAVCLLLPESGMAICSLSCRLEQVWPYTICGLILGAWSRNVHQFLCSSILPVKSHATVIDVEMVSCLRPLVAGIAMCGLPPAAWRRGVTTWSSHLLALPCHRPLFLSSVCQALM